MGKKKLLIIVFGIISLGLIATLENKLLYNGDRETVTNNIINTKKKKSSGIAMMLETSAGSGEYQESSTSDWPVDGYIFNETMSKCENGGQLTRDDTNKVVTFIGEASDRCYVYFDVKKPTAAETITKLYTTDGANGLYKHDGQGTYGAYEAGDNSYRFSGANPNNYVCFGTDAATCPTDNLYRIIGIFDEQIKLIKYDYATPTQLGTDGDYSNKTYLNTGWSTSNYKGSNTTSNLGLYYWNYNENNIWSNSELYTTNLNLNFINYLETSDKTNWSQYISDAIWIVGGNTWANIGTQTNAKTVYENELKSPATVDKVTAKIGLMYVSDYRYAADPTKASAWSVISANSYNNSTVKSNNWMYMGIQEWLISPRSDIEAMALFLYETGDVNYYYVGNGDGCLRPCFYLNSNVEIFSGTGTKSDPYRIA